MGKWDFDLMKNFEKHKEGLKNEEILERVRQVEKDFRMKQPMYTIVALVGVFVLIIGSIVPDGSKIMIAGLFCGLTGVIAMIQMNIIMKVSLYHLYNYWISNNRFEAEIRKFEAADL